jgi:phage FluMu gp28-like protein
MAGSGQTEWLPSRRYVVTERLSFRTPSFQSQRVDFNPRAGRRHGDFRQALAMGVRSGAMEGGNGITDEWMSDYERASRGH